MVQAHGSVCARVCACCVHVCFIGEEAQCPHLYLSGHPARQHAFILMYLLSDGICLVKGFEKADWKFYYFLTQSLPNYLKIKSAVISCM